MCAYNGTTSQFTYAADGIRHRSVVNGVTTDFALDASMFVRELRNGASTATYLIGARGPEYRRDDTAGTVSWNLFDGLGSVLAEVSPAGVITSSRNYDVYGNVRSGVNPNGTSAHKFVGNLGHPSDNNTGLIYMQARYMDPATGRFVSEDPGRQHANWLIYATSNPATRIDPNGQDDMAEEMETNEIAEELEGQNGLASFDGARWYSSARLVKVIQNLLGCTSWVANAIIHAAKDGGLGGADNIGIDSAGGLWSKSGEFLGFVEDFLRNG